MTTTSRPQGGPDGVPPASPAHPAPIGYCELPKLDGREISPGVWLIGEPTPVPGTNKLRGLANVADCLCVVELSLKFYCPADGVAA